MRLIPIMPRKDIGATERICIRIIKCHTRREQFTYISHPFEANFPGIVISISISGKELRFTFTAGIGWIQLYSGAVNQQNCRKRHRPWQSTGRAKVWARLLLAISLKTGLCRVKKVKLNWTNITGISSTGSIKKANGDWKQVDNTCIIRCLRSCIPSQSTQQVRY